MSEPAPPARNPPPGLNPTAPPRTPDLAYEEVTEPGYPAAYTACLRIEPTGDGAVLTGICPRCRCTMVYTWTRSVVRAASRTRRGRTGTGLVAVPVLCVCVTGHPGRPDDEEGCGAYWNIQLERERR
ncbi:MULTISPECIES: hypothetical protein [unclassified Streptomyces]|uniref:hypothetical protein n=1 Tax=unclassified Streptomyces TaxID=2593676 RepID=UPI00381ACD6E